MARFQGHDFEANRQRIREFLREQESLSDFDVEGTIFDTIISVLAESTEKNALTANMFFAESQIESATLRRNLSVLARRYGYLPYSAHAAKAVVDLNVILSDFEDIDQITISKGSVFSSGQSSSPFTLTDTVKADRNESGRFEFGDVEIRQGVYGSMEAIYNNSPIKVDVEGSDNSLLEVYVQETPDSSNFTRWVLSTDRVRIGNTDRVFFLSEFDDGRYQIEFGDGTVGRKPNRGAIIKVIYFKTVGSEGNGFSDFQFSLTPDNSSLIRTNRAEVTTITKERSAGGTSNESNESIRRNAPRFLLIQNRAVTLNDYESMIRNRFPYIRSTSVWSGAEGGSDRFEQPGRIYISANTRDSEFLSESQKQDLLDSIQNDFGVFAITPVIVDSSMTYIDLNVEVFLTETIVSQNESITDLINEYASSYSADELSSFKSSFRLSHFVSGVDRLSQRISSNLTRVTLHKDYYPRLNEVNNFEIDFHNPVISVVSNEFMIYPSSRRVFLRSSDSIIKLIAIGDDGNESVVSDNIGSVNLQTGIVSISNLQVSRFNSNTKTIRFFTQPESSNIFPKRNNVISIGNMKTTLRRI